MFAAFDIVFAPFWICLALAVYSLTLDGVVWKLMVGTILASAIGLAGITIHDYLEQSNLWFITPTLGGPILLFMLLASGTSGLKAIPSLRRMTGERPGFV